MEYISADVKRFGLMVVVEEIPESKREVPPEQANLSPPCTTSPISGRWLLHFRCSLFLYGTLFLCLHTTPPGSGPPRCR